MTGGLVFFYLVIITGLDLFNGYPTKTIHNG
jgi:hypothetical protein